MSINSGKDNVSTEVKDVNEMSFLCEGSDAVKFLVDTGVLFELNRTLLHPSGLALVVGFRSDGSGSEYFISGIIKTDDPAGIVFDEESFDDGFNKYKKFREKDYPEHPERLGSYGYSTQISEDLVKKFRGLFSDLDR